MADTHASKQNGDPEGRAVRVWDIAVRLFHWSLAVAFFLAYFTEDDLLTIHVWAGYTVGGLIVLRVIWGFVGPQHARFADFVFGPAKTIGYVAGLLRFRAKRYLGHSPAGGAMVIALLLVLAATVWSGLETYALEENAGPLAAWRTAGEAEPGSARRESQVNGGEEKEGNGEDRENGQDADEFWEDLHEILADAAMILVLLHIAGVVLASIVHRENLVRAMITGRKRAP